MANSGSFERENLQEFESGAAPENLQNLEVKITIDLPIDVSELDTSSKVSLERRISAIQNQRDNLKRKAPLYHKGVHLKQCNNKFVARLCLSGGKKKLELGEYQSHDEAARAYDVGAFYYQRLDCNCADRSFQDKLPAVPDNICEEDKRSWVREIARRSARQLASSVDLGRPTSASDRELGSGCSSLFTSQLLEGPPSTAASFGTQEASFGNPVDASTPGTSVSDTDTFVSGRNDHDRVRLLDVDRGSFVDLRKRKAASHVANDTTWWTQASSPVSRRPRLGLANLEEHQERNSHDSPLLADKGHNHQAAPQLKITDSILFAQCLLRKQGWVLRLKPRSPSPVVTGLLFSFEPQGTQHVPALLISDNIISCFYELREQGWEVHLEASKPDNIEFRDREKSSKSSNSSDIAGAEGLAPPRAAASLHRMNMSPSSNAQTAFSSPKCSLVVPDHDAANLLNIGNTIDEFQGGNPNNYGVQLGDKIPPWWDWP